MKPKDYVKKYQLTQPEVTLNRGDFLSDLVNDFLATIEYLRGANQLSYTRFKLVINELHQKFTSIKIQAKISENWDSLWSEFHSKNILAIQENLFGDYLRKEKAKKDAKQRREQEYYNSMFGRFDQASKKAAEDFWEEMLLGYLLRTKSSQVPNESFTKLGLTSSASEEDVKKSFRSLALENHPDKNGKASDMIQIIEAKNKCMAFLKNKSQTI